MHETEIIESLQKNFSVTFTGVVSAEELRQQLSAHINYLIVHDFHQLVNLLYRIDVPEEKLKHLLASHTGEDASVIIAGLIIERQLQKLKSRKSGIDDNREINEEDRW